MTSTQSKLQIGPIGGFFELETAHADTTYHRDALALTSGRSCINFILKETRPQSIWVPLYICDAALEPIKENSIDFRFYHIDENLDPVGISDLGQDELLLYINYFGLKDTRCKQLSKRFGAKLIVDNSQAFFAKPLPASWGFNSARKFFGVPDGAYVYKPLNIKEGIRSRQDACAPREQDGQEARALGEQGGQDARALREQEGFSIGRDAHSLVDYDKLVRRVDIKYDHLIQRLLGDQSAAFESYKESEKAVSSEILAISKMSENLLAGIDYEGVKSRRQKNFEIYQDHLAGLNELGHMLRKDDHSADSYPLCYPFLNKKFVDREKLAKSQIFLATYWNDVLDRSVPANVAEQSFCNNLLPLPIDHRYTEKECMYVIQELKSCL